MVACRLYSPTLNTRVVIPIQFKYLHNFLAIYVLPLAGRPTIQMTWGIKVEGLRLSALDFGGVGDMPSVDGSGVVSVDGDGLEICKINYLRL